MLTNILLLICSSDDTLVLYCVLCMIYKILDMFKVAKGDLHAVSYYSAIFFPTRSTRPNHFSFTLQRIDSKPKCQRQSRIVRLIRESHFKLNCNIFPNQ